MTDMWTQRYVSNALEQITNASSVKAPEVYHAFECVG